MANKGYRNLLNGVLGILSGTTSGITITVKGVIYARSDKQDKSAISAKSKK